MGEKISAGGIDFDSDALDALLDDAPTAGGTQDDNSGTVAQDIDQTTEDIDVQREEGVDQEAISIDESADETSDVDDQGETIDGEGSGDSGDTAGVVPEGDFITNGDEGPMLMTGAGEDGTPLYETADELFGDHKFKIKAAGEEHEVTFSEMRQGYQRQTDYTKSKTKIAEIQRAMQPYIGLLSYFEKDGGFREAVGNYIEGVKSAEVTNDDILAASESGDQEKVKALLDKQKKSSKRIKALRAANEAAATQQQQIAVQQHEIAKSLIPDYNDSVPKVKTFLTNLGYGEQELTNFEYLDARLQNAFYLAFKGANPTSKSSAQQKPGKRTLQATRKRIVKRSPKAVKAASGQSNTPKSRSSRKAKAAFKRAYETRKPSDFTTAIASVLPDNLLDD